MFKIIFLDFASSWIWILKIGKNLSIDQKYVKYGSFDAEFNSLSKDFF